MTWKQLPFKVKALIALVTAAAFPIAAWAIWDLVNVPHEADWLILLILTLVTVPAFLVLPASTKSSTIIGIGDTFIMAVSMLYGPSPCILTTLLHTVAATYLVPGLPKVCFYKVVFNSSSMICGALLYSWVYIALNPPNLQNPVLNTDPRVMLIPAAALTMTFFLFNSIITSVAIAWASHEKPVQFWVKNCFPLTIDFSVSAVAAVVIAGSAHLWRWAPLCAAPIVGLIWTWNKTNQAKAIEAVNHLKEQEQLYARTVETLAVAVDAKDQTTGGHIRRVRAYALGLAELKGITDPVVLKAIDFGSLLHDIGKLAVDDYILNKPSQLNKKERVKMQFHTTAGARILQKVEFPFPVANYVCCHHERWDGKGYPAGLKGEEIPLGARILSIADAFDAIRSPRPYKSSFSIDDSVELLRTQAGHGYDPMLVELFTQHIHELELAANEAERNDSEPLFRGDFENVDSEISRADASLAEQPLPASASDILIRLNEFCGGVGRSLELAVSLPFIARRIAEIVPYNSCVFYLYQEEDDLIKAEYACGDFAESLSGIKIKLGQRISGYVAAHERPMCNADPAREFEGLSKLFAPFKAALVVPLLHAGECLGTISLYNNNSDFYTPTHLNLLQWVAKQLALLLREVSGTDTLDPVTGLPRISYLSVAGTQALAHAEKSEAPLSLLYLKIKNFRQSAALYGSGSGDLILRKVAAILRSELRQTDILIRYGEDGFIALLPGVRGPQAIRYLNRLLQLIKSAPVSLALGNISSINCQAAVASYPNEGSNPLALLEAAQRFLVDQEKLENPQVAAPEGNVFEFPPRI